MPRNLSALAFSFLLAGCASSQLPSPPAEPEAVEVEPEPVVESEIPLEQRILAPFAVQSSGRPAPREPRVAAVVLDGGATPPPAQAAAQTQPDTSARARADTAAVAERTPQQPERQPAPSTPTTPRANPPAANTPPAASPAARPSTAAPAAAAPARGQPREHRVAAGETLMGISRRYGVSYTALLNSNPGIDPDRLRPDQVVRIPAGGAPTASGTPPAPARSAPAATPRTRTHTVAQGETLWSIARRYNVTVDQLRTANRLQGDNVRIGQTLTIPNG